MKKISMVILLSVLTQTQVFAKDVNINNVNPIASCDVSDNACLKDALKATNAQIKAAYARAYKLAPLKAKTTYAQDPQGSIKRSDFVKLHQSWLGYRESYCRIYSASMGLKPTGDFAVNAQCQIDLSKTYIAFLNTYEAY